MDRAKKALGLFEEGFNCSQSVCSVFADKFNLDEKTMLKFAGGFGGGVGASGLICGALSGAVMVLGLKYGATEGTDTDSKQHTRELVKEFIQKFNGEFGAIDCKCLLGFDMSKTEDFNYIHDNNITRQMCPKFVEFAVKELEKII